MQFPQRTLKRAQRAIACSPFTLKAFVKMRTQSIALVAFGGDRGVFNAYTQKPIAPLKAEKSLLWLIRVGVLRREVDGQGLTDSFRLTPLGRQVIGEWQQTQIAPQASWGDRFRNRWIRIFPIAF